jgi:hypothetical protein
MLRVEVDIFSGRPNPSWIVTSDTVTRRLLDALKEQPSLAAKVGSGFQGLGFRGLKIKALSDDEDLRLSTFLLANTGPKLKRAGGIAETLIKEMTKSERIVLPEHAITPIDKRMQKLILEELHRFVRKPPKLRKPPIHRYRGRRRTIKDADCTQCQYEISRFNPGFWNSDPFVQTNNNCYNYARNWRTDTFAQPGRASGNPTNIMACANVSNSARSDGLVDRCTCLPQSEYPRRLMALVIWPGGDYHWYRHQIGGFWGHKPGQTPAKNTDNSNVIVTNPETCDRGNYTDFCGYFYAGKSVTII